MSYYTYSQVIYNILQYLYLKFDITLVPTPFPVTNFHFLRPSSLERDVLYGRLHRADCHY